MLKLNPLIFQNLRQKFGKIDLPCVVHCKDIITEDNPGFELLEYIDAFPFYSDTNNLLSITDFKLLFHSVDTISGHNIWPLEECCFLSKMNFFDSYRIYPSCFFETKDGIYGFVIEVIDNDGLEKILYTFDKDLNLIDKLPLAFYVRHGSFTDADGTKGIWWTDKHATIGIDYRIETSVGDNRYFQILENGTIVSK